MNLKYGSFILLVSFLGLFLKGCTSAQTANDNFPSQSQYPNYKLVDARFTNELSIDVRKQEKVAIVVRDLSTTAYSNLPNPKYDNTYMTFEGAEICCLPSERLIGSSGLRVYKFDFKNKPGKTTIQLVARHKGLSPSKAHFESDLITKIQAQVD